MRFYEAVNEALNDCQASPDPVKSLVEIIEENIRADEGAFALELLTAFIKLGNDVNLPEEELETESGEDLAQFYGPSTRI
jgi:hypothetical protein